MKQFVTCEGHFGLVFLYHLRLLMIFIGFPLNMPYYLWRSLYKMARRYKKQCLGSSLFHHGLIKIMLVHQLKSQNNDWDSFLTRIGFANPNILEIDKPVIEETIIYPTTSTQACVKGTHSEPLPDPQAAEQTREKNIQPNASVKKMHENYRKCHFKEC
jgi:hypothetical protein